MQHQEPRTNPVHFRAVGVAQTVIVLERLATSASSLPQYILIMNPNTSQLLAPINTIPLPYLRRTGRTPGEGTDVPLQTLEGVTIKARRLDIGGTEYHVDDDVLDHAGMEIAKFCGIKGYIEAHVSTLVFQSKLPGAAKGGSGSDRTQAKH